MRQEEKVGDHYTEYRSQVMSTECETHTQRRNPLPVGIRGIQGLSAGSHRGHKCFTQEQSLLNLDL